MGIRSTTALVLTAIVLASCGGDSAGPDNGDPAGDQDGLAVRAVNTGTNNLEIDSYSTVSISICYRDIGCMPPGGGWQSVNPGHSMILKSSHPDSVAVGVRVGFQVLAGQGRAEIIRGVAYRTSGGFLEFTEGPVVHTSASFVAGETVEFTYGIVD